ncbi:variant erythrocyte surface antigen-1 alpha subunit [Babesia bovis T2Bo]|uniref:Variant erythrocyte surface antigen-1, alpha subunit n=1 Tax=Babesia bovis TaxID=5865 RepID=A7AT38_BABBO|nr:variant erythrocyte surface antigen-1 alpha subunit [Babesia bovis T2Bo]EDO06099.1 variant erythrocyte surface antigen-1 alpha subunit [Babesia bovis T2Bo]|eukprot:XP_001609667.1 variant erythrocyte surface antigen-1, alpha subunit [Babesia bovis T2Bo]
MGTYVLHIVCAPVEMLPDNVRYSGTPSTTELTPLQNSVELEYNGYQGDTKDGADTSKGATKEQVTKYLNELFSLVQGLGGTAVVRTYIDQLAQVLSALVGWSRIVKCTGGDSGGCKGTDKCTGNNGGSGGGSGGGKGCEYLKDIEPENKCDTCGCIKWTQSKPGTEGVPLGRRCTRCSGSRDGCMCSGEQDCTPDKCQCALNGKCCKCCCKSEHCKEKCQKNSWGGEKECICTNKEDSYRSAYPSESYEKRVSFLVANRIDVNPYWRNVTSSRNRHQCAQILLGSVCLIWSGITYMYWTGKWHGTSPRWNNHILDGSGLDDGTLSQWLQALGFPKEMLNDAGPGNRLDAVIWDGLSDKLLLGFKVPSGSTAKDHDDNTARKPAGMNYAGLVHTIHRDSFNNDGAIVFPQNGTGSSTTDTNQHKNGAIFKLYILSCAYFTGLQKRNSESTTHSTPRNPKTIREILYWLSALPYSEAYKEMLKHGKERLEKVLKKPGETDSTNGETQLKFIQTDRPAPITVDEFNLFAHFQAVTQYCPLVLIGIQGGIHSTDKTLEPAIHSLYANTECQFTYPTVSIQAYNQVVHYIRALFYQLYFLRKQCAVKVTCGGKWRECRYGDGVLGKDVVSWMCLGCDPMEHDRGSRVGKVKGVLDGVKGGGDAGKLKDVLEKIGEVVVQLGNAQEALERRKGEEIKGVQKKLQEAKKGLEEARKELETGEDLDEDDLKEAKEALGELTNGGGGALHTLANGSNTAGSLHQVATAGADWQKEYSSAKDKISEVIHKIQEVLTALQTEVPQVSSHLNGHKDEFTKAIEQLISICNTAKCLTCMDHSSKCGQEGKPYRCTVCDSMAYSGVPSPLQAFLEDRLPGFSCSAVVNQDENPDYPSAASHLGHCSGSGQCCPLPMGFRGHFHGSSTSDCTGHRLYGILYFFSNGDMMQSCVYTLVRVTAALSATTPQVLGDVFGFFRGGVGNKESGKNKNGQDGITCQHQGDPSKKQDSEYFCGWCASGLREEVKGIQWIPKKEEDGGQYRGTVGQALIQIKGEKNSLKASTNLSTLTTPYLSPLTGELYTAVSATFGGTYLSWVLYLSDSLQWGLKSLATEFKQIECRGCRECDPNKCKKGSHGSTAEGSKGTALCQCQSIVSCTGVLPVLYRHGFSYGNPFNLEGYRQEKKGEGDYSIMDNRQKGTKKCHQFLDSLNGVIDKNRQGTTQKQDQHPLTELLKQVGKLQYDIRLPWIFVLTLAWLIAVLYLAFGAIWPLDWTHMRSHWLRGGEHQWEAMWYKVMTGRKGMELVEYFGRMSLRTVSW